MATKNRNGTFGFARIFTGSGNGSPVQNVDVEAENDILQKADVLDIDNREGAEVIDASFFNSTVYQTQDSLKNQSAKINEYRALSFYPEVEWAVDDIINAVVSSDSDVPPVKIDLGNVELSESLKLKISDEFENILSLLDFNETAYERLKEWYIDGRLIYQVVIDPNKKKDGIKRLIPLDPRAIKAVVEVKKVPNADRVEMIKKIDRYYIYDQTYAVENEPSRVRNNTNRFSRQQQRLRIEEDSIVTVGSGLVDSVDNTTLSYLEYARKPVNNLKSIEDAMVIYRLTRAPEKRAFYIDVGTLPKKASEEYMVSIMNRFKSNIRYDATTGKVNVNAQQMSMLQDYWLPRREGGRGTEVSSIQGATNMDDIDDVHYFLAKLYKALKVPESRINGDATILLGGRGAEISRDEWKFDKHIQRLRRRFSRLFISILRKQLVLKGITDLEDFDQIIKPFVKFMFASDGYMKEQQELDTLANRINLLGQADPFVGKYFSKESIERAVLRRSDEEIETERKKIVAELKAGIISISPPPEDQGLGGDPAAGGGGGISSDPNFGSLAVAPADDEPDETYQT